MFLWESIPFHSPLSSFSMAMSFHGLCSGPLASCGLCRGRILRLAFQSTVLAWKLPMASTFELASRWEEYGIAELWNSLCIFELNFPVNRDDQLSTTIYSNSTGYEHIWKHYNIYIYVYTVLYNIIYILYQIHPNTIVIGRWSSEDQVGNSDAFQKRGTSLALLKRGRAVGCLWSR